MYRMMDGALDKDQNILKLQHRTTVDILQRPGEDAFFTVFLFNAVVRDFREQLNRLHRRISNLIRSVLFQLLCYQWHVSADDLDERSSKKTSFTGKPGTNRENDAWCSVSRRSPWVTLLTAPAHRREQSLAMQHRSKLQYIQDSSPEQEASGLLCRCITQAHILQSRKKPTYGICFTETSSSQTR